MATRRRFKIRQLGIRVTAAEAAEIERWAIEANKTVAELVRGMFEQERQRRAAMERAA